MRKRVQAVILLIAMVVSVVGVDFFNPVDAKAASDITINVHYLRDDGNYSDWDVWMWLVGGEGNAVKFTGNTDANGAIATGTVPAGGESAGIIIRKGDWADKDPSDDDVIIPIAGVSGGTIDVYVISKSNAKAGTAADIKIDDSKAVKASGAVFTVARQKKDNTKEIEVVLSEDSTSIDANSITIKDSEGKETKVSSAKLDSKRKATITISGELDPLKAYTISYNGVEAALATVDYFSTKDFEDKYTYTGDDLGAVWSKKSTTFKLWAPTATAVKIITYKDGELKFDNEDKKYDMKQGDKGVWSATVDGDLNGTYYIYSATIDGKEVKSGDPYAKAVGVNGGKSMVVDLDSTDPSGWDKDQFVTVKEQTDASLYELQVRDFSSDPNSGIKNTGKYLAFTETGTKTKSGFPTGIDYIKDLGVNFVHLLPTYDFGSVDETKDTGYNWGYDPVNYFAVDGSYSTNPAKGEVRINEYKQMVQSLHNNNIGIVTDVVFNHVYRTGEFSYNKLVPGYYTRPNSNGSGCGNDVASERSMVRKYIVDCVTYWQNEYHIDGYRWDLMGLLDVETMNQVADALTAVNEDVIIYGEGWYASKPILTKDDTKLALKDNAKMTERIAYFSDNIRDAIKGSVFEKKEGGFVQGKYSKIADIVDGVKGAPNWAANPSQVVNYCSAHDNNTIFDKITLSSTGTEEDVIKMNFLSAAIVQLSEGIPFIMSGEEGARTKARDGEIVDASSNSYNTGDDMNKIDYERADEYNKKYGIYDYYKGLIEFRMNHSALRCANKADVDKALKIENFDQIKNDREAGIVIYSLDKVNGEVADGLYIVLNSSTKETTVTLPSGNWNLCVNGEKAGTDVIEKCSGTVKIAPVSCYAFVKGATTDPNASKIVSRLAVSGNSGSATNNTSDTKSGNSKLISNDDVEKYEHFIKNSTLISILIAVAAVLMVVGVVIYFTTNRAYIQTLKTEREIVSSKSENRLLKSIEEEEKNK